MAVSPVFALRVIYEFTGRINIVENACGSDFRTLKRMEVNL